MNYDLVSYPRWRVAAVSMFARVFGVQVHIEGVPFGGRARSQGGDDYGR